MVNINVVNYCKGLIANENKTRFEALTETSKVYDLTDDEEMVLLKKIKKDI